MKKWPMLILELMRDFPSKKEKLGQELKTKFLKVTKTPNALVVLY